MSPIKYHTGKFPPGNIIWESLVPLLGPANAAVARYDGVLSAIPNPVVLLSPLSTQDAVLSSRIEGTQATMGDVLKYEAGEDTESFPPERKADIQEILNYRAAMHKAVEMLGSLPLCQRIIKEAHRLLLDSVRGKEKRPGVYRVAQNWIGSRGCSIEQARFIPVAPEMLVDGMSAWEKFVHFDYPDRLVHLAVLHAEFEALHPFNDGNGRLGRMLVPLYMFQTKIIQSPMFYISAFFEANRDEYYDRLLSVSANDDWNGWCIFFLKAVIQQAEENRKKAAAILALYNDLKIRIPQATHSQYAMKALDWIFARPIFKSTDFIDSSHVPAPTARRILDVLRKENILKTFVEAKGRRSAILTFPDLLNTAEGRKVF
jgi:Fic family protein